MKARLINWYRRLFPHPVATAARVERERARKAAATRRHREIQTALAKFQA